MSISTYQELQDSVLSWMARAPDDEDTELVNRVRDFIRLGEARFCKELRVREMEYRLVATLNEKREALPARFLAMETLSVQFPETGFWRALRQVSHRELSRYWRYQSTNQNQYVYSTVGNEILFGPFMAFNSDATEEDLPKMELVCFAAPKPLSDANPTNRILDTYPDIYLYSALIESQAYVISDQLDTWVAAYNNAVSMANDAMLYSDEAIPVGAPSSHIIV